MSAPSPPTDRRTDRIASVPSDRPANADVRFDAELQADLRRERHLLYAEIVLLVLLSGLAVLRYWVGP